MQKTITYNLIRSKRKTIAIHITKNATVEVRAPLRTSQKEIDAFVNCKREWINKHQNRIEQVQEQKTSFTLTYGEQVYLCGKAYSIIAKEGNHAGFDGQYFYLPPNLSGEEIRQTIIQLYKKIAKTLLTNRTLEYAKRTGLMPIAIKVNSAKTRWGSCSGKNSINFSWRLIMASDDIIDYVVVHELAHIKEHNHSVRFWAVVASILPDYKTRERKLKEFQKQIANENWD